MQAFRINIGTEPDYSPGSSPGSPPKAGRRITMCGLWEKNNMECALDQGTMNNTVTIGDEHRQFLCSGALLSASAMIPAETTQFGAVPEHTMQQCPKTLI